MKKHEKENVGQVNKSVQGMQYQILGLNQYKSTQGYAVPNTRFKSVQKYTQGIRTSIKYQV